MRQSFTAARLIHAGIAAALMVPMAACATTQTSSTALEPALRTAASAPTRTAANVARDPARHPVETLGFFGVQPGDTVVEIWPGGGWYTEILAPYLTAGGGKLYVAPPAGRGTDNITAKLTADAATYGTVTVAPITAGSAPAIPSGSADVVLTFRNVHNWLMGTTPQADAMFAEMFRMLKPGGTLGIVDHRLPESGDAERERSSGYLKTSTVRALAEKAGFRLVESSEVNANPKDTADWPQGVWTLPPTFRLGETDRAKYQAIGESDRMTLRFVKPE